MFFLFRNFSAMARVVVSVSAKMSFRLLIKL